MTDGPNFYNEIGPGDLDHASSQRLDGRRGLLEDAERAPQLKGWGPSFWADADWIPCRDGKARPVESKFVALADGAAGGLGLVRPGADQEGEEIDAPQVDRDGQGGVRTVLEGGLQTARPPQGREPSERRPVELADFVRLLPSSLALAELHGDTATAEALHALLESSGAQGLVQYTPVALKTAWRSLGEEGQDRFRLAVESGSWMRTVEHPLAHGAHARVGRLRAYGNAINAEAARAVIVAAMGCLR